MAKAKKKVAKKKAKVDKFGRTAASRIRTAETVARDAEEATRGYRRENQILRLQNGALMDVIRAHTEQVDGLLTQLVQVNAVMRARAKQHQAEGLLRSISDGAA